MDLGPHHITASLNVPPSQNTAPVLEYRCLYTQDLRRKQKRWSDGRLKFHTFNKRVMVYDERSNLVGDAHWRQDYDLGEGEELELERGGILVEVAECIGKNDQDLYELVEKRLRAKEERAAAAKAAAGTPARPTLGRTQGSPMPSSLLPPKPLNAILTPSGHYGKATISDTSPCAERRRLANVNGDGNAKGRPAKRRKLDETTSVKSGFAQNLMGASLSLIASKPSSIPTIRYEPVRMSVVSPTSTQTMDLTGEEDERSFPKEVRESAIEEASAMQRLSRIRKKTKTTKPGYASQLTGVSLSLSRPDSIITRPHGKFQTTKSAVPEVEKNSDQYPLVTEDDDVLGMELTPNMVTPASMVTEAWASAAEPHTLIKPSSLRPSYSAITKAVDKPLKESAKRSKLMESTAKPQRERSPPHSSSVKGKPALQLDKDAWTTKEIGDRHTKVLKTALPPNLRSLPPRNVVAMAPMSNRSHEVSLGQQAPSAAESSTQRPGSSLRIKSRPARKLMMLMDRSSSRPPSFSESLNIRTTNSQTSQDATVVPKDPILSQASIEVAEVCQRQEKRIQTRLNRTNRPAINFDDLSSEPEEEQATGEADTGINHQTIDRLSCRRSSEIGKHRNPQLKRPARKNSAISLTSTGDTRENRGLTEEASDDLKSGSCETNALIRKHAAVGHAATKKQSRASGAVVDKDEDVEWVEGDLRPIFRTPFGAGIKGLRMSRQISNTDSDLSLLGLGSESKDNEVVRLHSLPCHPAGESIQQKSKIHPPRQPGLPQVNTYLPDITASTAVANNVVAPRFNVNTQTSGGQDYPKLRTMSNLQDETAAGLTRQDAQDKTTKLRSLTRNNKKSDCLDAVQVATERAWNLTKNSDSPQHSIQATEPAVEVLQTSYSPDTEQGNEVTIKSSSRPKPLTGGLSKTANGISGGNEPPSHESMAGPAIAIGKVPAMTIVQPATVSLANTTSRGKLVQTLTVETVESLTSATNHMDPPPQRISSRPGRVNAGDNHDVPVGLPGRTGGASAARASMSGGGPWSRESFDLFGSWRPPSRGVGTYAITGS